MEVSRELTNSEYSEGLIEVSTFFPVSYSEYDIGLVDFESRYYLPTFIDVESYHGSPGMSHFEQDRLRVWVASRDIKYDFPSHSRVSAESNRMRPPVRMC